MAVNDTTPSVQYTATASQTTFAYPFEIFGDEDLKVYQVASSGTPDDTNDILVLTTDYTVTGAGSDSGGNVVLVTGATVGDVITIKRDIAMKRTTDYQNLGDLASESFNIDLDKLLMMAQQNKEAFGRAISLQESTQTPSTFDIDDPVADYYATAKTDLSGIKWVSLQSSGDLSVSAFAETLLDDTTAGEMRATINAAGLSSDNAFTGENTYSKTQAWAKGADIASATALTLGTDGNYFDVTGTTTVTSISTVGIGATIKIHFDGVLVLTHHATDLFLPGEANITTAAGDEAEFIEYATGDWRCTNYQKASIPVIEEGTWTPTLNDNSTGVATLVSSAGTYEKIGRQVTARGKIQLSGAGTMTTGTLNVYIKGLPYTASLTSGEDAGGGSISTQSAVTVASGTFAGTLRAYNDYFALLKQTASATDAVKVSEISFGGTHIYFTVTYMTA